MKEGLQLSTSTRRGRPPSQETSLIDELVLQEATALFLANGYARTSLDLVAKNVGIGKSALYRRYPGKEELFAAVVKSSINTMFSDMKVPDSCLDDRQRLQVVGEELVKGMLHPRCVAFMRITAAEAESFPELARMAYAVSFEDSVKFVARALNEKVVCVGNSVEDVAKRFVEVAVQPLSFQAAFGLDPMLLHSKASKSVGDAIYLLISTGSIKI